MLPSEESSIPNLVDMAAYQCNVFFGLFKVVGLTSLAALCGYCATYSSLTHSSLAICAEINLGNKSRVLFYLESY